MPKCGGRRAKGRRRRDKSVSSERAATARKEGKGARRAEKENLQTISGHHSGDAGAVSWRVGVTPQCGVAICRLALRVSPSVAPPALIFMRRAAGRTPARNTAEGAHDGKRRAAQLTRRDQRRDICPRRISPTHQHFVPRATPQISLIARAAIDPSSYSPRAASSLRDRPSDRHWYFASSSKLFFISSTGSMNSTSSFNTFLVAHFTNTCCNQEIKVEKCWT